MDDWVVWAVLCAWLRTLQGETLGVTFRVEECLVGEQSAREGRGVLDCAVKCINAPTCDTFSHVVVDSKSLCRIVTSTRQDEGAGAERVPCYKRSYREPGQSATSATGTAARDPTTRAVTTNPVALVPTTSTTGEEVIVELVQIGKGLCSDYDYAIVTNKNVYIYDNFDWMVNGIKCKTVSALGNLFPGNTDLPALSDIGGMLIHDQKYIRLFSGGRIWQWTVKAGGYEQQISYPKKMSEAYGGTFPSSLKWAVYMSKNGNPQHHFADADGHTYQCDGDFLWQMVCKKLDPSAADNPWKQIPNKTLGVMTTNSGKYFFLVDEQKNLYEMGLSTLNDFRLRGQVRFP